jgi:hypothetical protein
MRNFFQISLPPSVVGRYLVPILCSHAFDTVTPMDLSLFSVKNSKKPPQNNSYPPILAQKGVFLPYF